MSGDVQPRRRRDKKKKKDEGEDAGIQHYARVPSQTPVETDDVTIHVQKDDGTGGGICAKLVFFLLLSVLAVLIGLIITEHRGLTSYSIERESRITQYFEGWVNNANDDHDDHDVSADHDDDDGHDDDDHDHNTDHSDEDVVDDHEVEDEEEHGKDVSPEEEETVAISEQQYQSEEADDEEEEENSEAAQSEEDAQDDDKEEDSIENDEEQEHEDNNDEDMDKEAQSEEAVEEHSQEMQKSDEEVSLNFLVNDEDKDGDDGDQDGDEDDNHEEGEPIGVIKASVGIAIVVVAYIVLVKKWKSEGGIDDDDDGEKKAHSELTRRNTIVIPPKVKVVEQVVKDQSYSSNEEEVEEVQFYPKVKKTYQTLRQTYERSLTPDQSDTENGELNPDEEDIDDGEDDEDYDQGDYEEEIEGDEEAYEYEGEDEELEVEDEVEEIPSDEDEELMKKLEAKYGKLSRAGDVYNEEEFQVEEDYDDEEELDEEEIDDDNWKNSQPTGGPQFVDETIGTHWTNSADSYPLENITNLNDFSIFHELDEAHANIDNNPALALSQFNQILNEHPSSPRALYGKARALDNLAELKQSNDLLNQAITAYNEVIKSPSTPDALMIASSDRCINRLRFMGHYSRAISIHETLMNRFPHEIKHRNQLAVTFLTINKINDARVLLQKTLQKWPRDGFALAHYGFILKVNDNNLSDGVEFLKAGIATKQDGVIDGRFFVHLGDALMRLGRHEEAAQVHRDGVDNKVFLSVFQRSLYNVHRLTGRPWWSTVQLPIKYQRFIQVLEANYPKIRDEGLAALNQKGFFQEEAENLRESGDWKQFELFGRGIKHKQNCQRAPNTCRIVESFSDSINCRRGQIKFSVMHPGTHVWPHCGPTNCRLRMHLGLKVPAQTFIRVADSIRSWEEGSVIIFDDSFEHEVWHNGSDFRLVLIVDVWHPELSNEEKRSLSTI